MSEGIGWKVVNNTVNRRMVDFSLIHKLIPYRKLKRRTKIMNKKIKRAQIVKTYKQYVNMKTCILRDFSDDNATDESEILEDADYSNLYNSDILLANYKTNVNRKCTNNSFDIVKEVETKDNISNLAKKRANSQNSKRKSSADVGWRDVIKKKPIESASQALKGAQKRKSTVRNVRISLKYVQEESGVTDDQLSSESTFMENDLSEENNISRNNEACIAKRLVRSSNKINSSNKIMPDIIAGEELRDINKSLKRPAKESPKRTRNEISASLTASTKSHLKKSQLDENCSQDIIKESQSNESQSQDKFKSQSTPEESQLNESSRDMFTSQLKPESVKKNLMSALDEENESTNLKEPSISTETNTEEARVNCSSKSPVIKRTSNKNKRKAFPMVQSVFNDNTNQPKDSGIDEDTEEELPEGRKKVCKKKKGNKRSNENLQTASSTSECETNPTVQTNSPSIDNNSNQSLNNDALDKVNTENLMSSEHKNDDSGEGNSNESLTNNMLKKENSEDLISSDRKSDNSRKNNIDKSLANNTLGKENSEDSMSSDRKSDNSRENNIDKSLANNTLGKENSEDSMSSDRKSDDSREDNMDESLANNTLSKENSEDLKPSEHKSDDSSKENINKSLVNNITLGKENSEDLKPSDHKSDDSSKENINESLTNNITLDKTNTEELKPSDHKSDDSSKENINESLTNNITLDKTNTEELKPSDHKSDDSSKENINESLTNNITLDKTNTEELKPSDHKSDDSSKENINESLSNNTLDKENIEELKPSNHISDDCEEDNIEESLTSNMLKEENSEDLISSDSESYNSEEDNIDESLANNTLDNVKIEDLTSSDHKSDDSGENNINESLTDKVYSEDLMLSKHRSDDSEEDQQDRSSRQKSQPRVMCTEIIKKKYRIVPCDTSLLNGSTNLETNARYSSDEEVPESMEMSQSMDDSMSPFSKRRLQRMKRLNLTEDSESSLSENDDKHCTAENMRNQLLKRSGESSDVSSNENESTNVKNTMLVHFPEKQKTYKKLKIEKYKREKTSCSIKMHEEYEETSDTENSCEPARKSLSKQSNEKNTSENSFEGIASRLDVQYNSKSVNNRNLDSCESNHLSNTENHNSDRHEAKNSLKTGTTADVVPKKSRIRRPSNLQGFIEEENLTCDTTMPSLVLRDIEDEDVFILDVPSRVLEHNLVGERIYLSKRKLKLGKQKYKVISKDINRVTCVFGTITSDKPYKTVNITPLASIVANEKIKPSVKTLNQCTSDGKSCAENTSKTKTHLRHRKKRHKKTCSKYIRQQQSEINN